ncbi:MAG: Dephospho-CoA kinase [uncultured Propionibacteriaceae bacterium]|uniref:Dephospho-CoA kinase n=1 Tax=uncultured Propionibacteriaceae bacterium TaxID=257457 RepID=A0A6J4N8I8_9ACTN|nr:MAG: Dephospho-CoA kinase [uncultured Propionibacteriaceae bacterium]
MVRVGLTGGIASGKTAAAELLAERGAVVIDADVLAREVVQPGTPGLDAVVDRFSTDVLNSDGSLDRPALATVVFADATARRDLEAIIHPAVRSRAAAIEAAAPAGSIVVHVIPLLVETGQERDFDVCVVVDADPQQQLERLQARNGLSAAEAEARIGAQATREERLAAADHVIDNNGTPQQLAAQVDRLWQLLLRREHSG